MRLGVTPSRLHHEFFDFCSGVPLLEQLMLKANAAISSRHTYQKVRIDQAVDDAARARWAADLAVFEKPSQDRRDSTIGVFIGNHRPSGTVRLYREPP